MALKKSIFDPRNKHIILYKTENVCYLDSF